MDKETLLVSRIMAKPTPLATDVMARTILFENVKQVERLGTQTTSTTDYDCKDLELC